MTSHVRLSLVIAFTGFAFLSSAAHAQVYPSAGAFWVIGAGWQDPTDPQTIQDGLVTGEDVIRWEATHADFAAWTCFKYRPYVPTMVTLDYLYVGALSESGTPISNSWEPELRKIAINKGHNYEDFLLHYQRDTWQNLTTLYQDEVAWAGVPVAVGYTLSADDQTEVVLPGTGPWSADIFEGVNQGGAFYLADPETFAEATFTFQPGGAPGTHIMIQYASAVSTDGNFTVTQWKPLLLTPTGDGTKNFTQSGRISWIPPRDWVWGYNPVPHGVSQHYAYWLRITGTGRPMLTNLKTRQWVGLDPDPASPYYRKLKVLGWDSANDRNGDGYVDDNEYAGLVKPDATARFRYEGRVAINWIAFDRKWSYCYTNTANPLLQQDVAEYYRNFWQGTTPYNGGYNDNFFVNLLSYFNPILAGGLLAPEGPIQGQVDDPQTNLAYSAGFDATLKAVKQATATQWMGTNTYFLNPYDYHPFNVPYPDLAKTMLNSRAFDWFILEGTLFDSWSMVDAEAFGGQVSGLSRVWHIAALAKSGLKSAIMERIGPHLLTPPSTQAMWERSQTGLLAQYYLYHFSNLTSLQFIYYNNTDITQLTTVTPPNANYYKPGVPADYAYQPHRMLAVDIGTPAATSPPGYPAMQYTAAVDGTGQLNNTVVGLSTDTVLSHPVYGQIPVLPTATYYLVARESAPYTKIVTDPQGRPFPAEVVLARQYTKGMVLFRTSFSYPVDQNNNPDYRDYASDGNQITVTLPCTYQQVNFDGTLAPPSNQITLHGFEGAVLFNPAPVIITSPVVTSGYFGRLFGYKINATNSPTSFGASGLPSGLRVDTTTGLISGLPRVRGTFQVGLSATNVDGTGTATLQITVR